VDNQTLSIQYFFFHTNKVYGDLQCLMLKQGDPLASKESI